jgi:hypothetical protein
MNVVQRLYMNLFADEPTTLHRPHGAPLATRMIQGSLLVAGLMLLRLPIVVGKIPIGEFLRAVLAVALSGSLGGGVYYATDFLRVRGSWRQTIANVVSILAYGFFALGALVLVGFLHA